MSAHHVAHVQLRHFTSRQICSLVPERTQARLNIERILLAADAHAHEYFRPAAGVETVIEFRNHARTERGAELPECAGPFRDRDAEECFAKLADFGTFRDE